MFLGVKARRVNLRQAPTVKK